MGVRFTRSAVIAAGKRDEALGFAETVTKHYAEHYDLTLTWGVQIGGTLGTLYWYSDHDSLGALEEIFGRSMADPTLTDMNKLAGELFAGPAEDTIVYTM